MADQASLGSSSSGATTLIVIRGNSGSGKTAIAREVRLRYGRGAALIEQDHFRRHVLCERDIAGGLAPAFLAHNVAYLLDHGYHVVLEGILANAKYGDMLRDLLAAHRGRNHVWYLDVPFEETLRRHATRPQATQFTAEDMRTWYLPGDVLGVDGEGVIAHPTPLEASIDLIAAAAGWPPPGGPVEHEPAAVGSAEAAVKHTGEGCDPKSAP